MSDTGSGYVKSKVEPAAAEEGGTDAVRDDLGIRREQIPHDRHVGDVGHIGQLEGAVAQDGGDITFHGFRDGIVYLHMRGACAGCPSSTMTLKAGIENMLKHYVPEVVKVEAAA